MTKKALIGCIVTAIVLAALFSTYLFLTSDESRQEDAPSIVLNTKDKDEMVKLDFEKGDVSLSFVKDANGFWNFADEPTTPIYYAYVNNMASALTSFEPIQEIVGGNEADYGFDSPSLTVRCEYKNGAVYSAVFGTENEALGGVYMKEAESGKIYLVESALVSAFNETRETLTVPEDEIEE